MLKTNEQVITFLSLAGIAFESNLNWDIILIVELGLSVLVCLVQDSLWTLLRWGLHLVLLEGGAHVRVFFVWGITNHMGGLGHCTRK